MERWRKKPKAWPEHRHYWTLKTPKSGCVFCSTEKKTHWGLLILGITLTFQGEHSSWPFSCLANKEEELLCLILHLTRNSSGGRTLEFSHHRIPELWRGGQLRNQNLVKDDSQDISWRVSESLSERLGGLRRPFKLKELFRVEVCPEEHQPKSSITFRVLSRRTQRPRVIKLVFLPHWNLPLLNFQSFTHANHFI